MLITAATESPWAAFEAVFGVWLRSGNMPCFPPGLHHPRLAGENEWTCFLHQSHIQLQMSIPSFSFPVKGKLLFFTRHGTTILSYKIWEKLQENPALFRYIVGKKMETNTHEKHALNLVFSPFPTPSISCSQRMTAH